MRSWPLNARRAAITAGLFFVDWLFIWLAGNASRYGNWLDELLWPRTGDYPFGMSWCRWLESGAVLFPILTVLSLFVFVVRLVLRARLRATGADPLEPVRRWVATRRWTVRVLCAVPSLLVLASNNLFHGIGSLLPGDGQNVVSGLLLLVLGTLGPAAGVAAALRGYLHACLWPLVDPGELERNDADGFHFDAVAVTPEAVATVGLFTLASFGILALLAGDGYTAASTRGFPIAVVYGVAVLAGALSFQRRSRIALGLDGVRIGGTSRQRFHAYRDLDGVEVSRGGDLLLQRHGKTVLRLQLHGEDAGRRAPIVTRLREAIERAHTPGGAARRLTEAASPALFAQAARGDGDYRSPAATRDALWEVVESPSASGDARTRAAQALAAGASGADRARLRFAAMRYADPPTRKALVRIAGDEEDGELEAMAAEEAEGRERRAAVP